MMFNLSVFRILTTKAAKCVTVISLTLLAVACAEFPGVYKVRVEQGNIIDQEMIAKLEVGQTKEQVTYILGSPLVDDTFSSDRWDYIYRVKHDNEYLRRKNLTVYFSNGLLQRFEHTGVEEKHKAAEEAKGPVKQ